MLDQGPLPLDLLEDKDQRLDRGPEVIHPMSKSSLLSASPSLGPRTGLTSGYYELLQWGNMF